MRPGFTRGGFTAQNEMCLLFLHYYPATRLAHCASRLSFKHVLLALGVNVWPLTRTTRHLGLRIKDPWQYQNLTFSDYLRVAATKDTAVSLKLQEASLHHSHKAECYDYGRRKIYAVSWEKSRFYWYKLLFIRIPMFWKFPLDYYDLILGWNRIFYSSYPDSNLWSFQRLLWGQWRLPYWYIHGNKRAA